MAQSSGVGMYARDRQRELKHLRYDHGPDVRRRLSNNSQHRSETHYLERMLAG